MGTSPDLLPGRQLLGDDAVRKRWQKNWKINLSPDAGLNMVRMIEAAEKGNLKALYIMGENPLRALPQSDRVQKALENLEFLVVQDILNSETARIADAVLPGAALSEKQGSVTNLEGRIQSFNPVVRPPGKSMADWQILDLLAARLGSGKPYESVEKIRSEIKRLVPMYASLNGNKEAWIELTSEKTLFNSENKDELIAFYPVVSIEDKAEDDDYGFTAIVGTQRYQLGSGTRTAASERIRDFAAGGRIEISPRDAAAINVGDGDTIAVRSKHGSVSREIFLKSGLSPGHIFVPTGVNKNDAMNLFSLSDLSVPGAAGWKTCNVKIEKA
jgi:predicted molibdopterin-dependent oxidoreductase YjgC